MAPVLVALALASAPASPQALGLSEAEWAALAKGEVVLHATDRAAVGWVRLARPAEAGLAEVEAYAGLCRYIPGQDESTVLERSGDTFRARGTTRALWLRYQYGLNFRVDRAAREVAWTLDRSQPSDIADTTGSWRFVALDEQSALLRYEVSVVPAGAVPQAVQSYFTRRSVPALLTAFRDHLEGK